VSQIYRVTQEWAMPLSPGQFIEKNHARIPERIERIHGQKVPTNV